MAIGVRVAVNRLPRSNGAARGFLEDLGRLCTEDGCFLHARWGRSMKALAAAFSFVALVGTATLAQTAHDHPDVVIDVGAQTVRRHVRADTAGAAQSGTIWTTADDQILVEMARGDTAPASLFDLNGRTVVFAPDGYGAYSRSVRPVAWEEGIGPAVADGAEIELESFMFAFAGRRWGSFFVSRHGLITFGQPLTYRYYDAENRFDTMSMIASKFVTTPTISPLYKPRLGGRSDRYGSTQHVAAGPNRVVVTWVTTEPDFYVHGIPPASPSRFQIVLNADGGIAFNYADVALRDGIVGLFPNEEITKGRLLGGIADPGDSGLPGHLDLLDAALYAVGTGSRVGNDSSVILEFTLRDRVRQPREGEWYSYRLHFDTDKPYWNHPLDWSDEDATWQIDVRPGGEVIARGRGVQDLLAGSGRRISLLADRAVLDGNGRQISAMAVAGSAHFDDDQWVQGDYDSRGLIELDAGRQPAVDLSRADGRFSERQYEVFHYRSSPDPVAVACRVIDALGDRFDLFVFHSEFRVDSQEVGTPVRPHYGNASKEGTGIDMDFGVPCGRGRLKAVWQLPVWMRSRDVYWDPRGEDRTGFESGLLLFLHEFTHAWTAHASYDRNGEREPLYGNYCRCHWREDLHLPAAFPWDPAEPGPRSVMGGRFWRENGDGTFTPLDGYWGGGPSWLDLYMMGLAKASEVPDMFVLRNLRPVSGDVPWGPHTGEKEMVTIEQVMAAEGRRRPPPARAQKNFNAGFVYLVAPGRTPSDDLLRLHTKYRDKVVEHWNHVTGGRSRMTTSVGGSP